MASTAGVNDEFSLPVLKSEKEFNAWTIHVKLVAAMIIATGNEFSNIKLRLQMFKSLSPPVRDALSDKLAATRVDPSMLAFNDFLDEIGEACRAVCRAQNKGGSLSPMNPKLDL